MFRLIKNLEIRINLDHLGFSARTKSVDVLEKSTVFESK